VKTVALLSQSAPAAMHLGGLRYRLIEGSAEISEHLLQLLIQVNAPLERIIPTATRSVKPLRPFC
jgi:hypothetical protein